MKTSFVSKEVFNKIKSDNIKYTAIILIIASRDETYDLFVQCWREYMNGFPNVKSYFLYSDESIQSDMVIDEDSIIYKDSESTVPGIFKKTIAAMSFCQKHLSYDYILRTNLSSFLHIPRLLNFLSNQSKELFAGAHFNKIPVDINHVSMINQITSQTKINTYFNKILNERFIYLHGACFILSNDVIAKLLNEVKTNYSNLTIPLELPDDVAISMILYNFLSFDEDAEFSEFYHPKEFVNLYSNKHVCKKLESPELYTDDNIFHIRNKISQDVTDNSIESRYNDIMNYIYQVRFFYNKPGFLCYVDEVPRKQIIDCFIFNDEVDILEHRLSILYNTVDKFILVESTKTNDGIEKPMFYADNKERLSKFNDKIIHITCDLQTEQSKRDYIDCGIKKLELSEHDYIMISDVNEIPDADVIHKIKVSHNHINFAYFKQDVCTLEDYFIPSKTDETCTLAKIITYQEYIKQGSSPSKIRESVPIQTIVKGGKCIRFSMQNDSPNISTVIEELEN